MPKNFNHRNYKNCSHKSFCIKNNLIRKFWNFRRTLLGILALTTKKYQINHSIKVGHCIGSEFLCPVVSRVESTPASLIQLRKQSAKIKNNREGCKGIIQRWQ
jgi:hypothetical protein